MGEARRLRLGGRLFAMLAVAYALGVGLAARSWAQEPFPSRRIEVVIHSKYGGGTDMTARLMAAGARQTLGVDLSVVSQWGGSGSTAHRYAAARPRDGYTLLSLTQTHLYTLARGKSPLTIDDVVGLARAVDDPTLVVVPAASPFQTFGDLVAASRRAELDWGVSNIGGTEHIGLARLAAAAGFEFTAVPFGSGARMLQGMLSRSVDATLANLSEVAGFLDDGSVRALALLSPHRLRDRPTIPTSFELGHPIKVSTTRGFWVLRGTPEDRVRTLSDGIVEALESPAFVDFLVGLGLDPAASIAGSEEWNRQIRSEYEQAVVWLGELGLLE